MDRGHALWLSIASVPGIGQARLLALMTSFPSPLQVVEASPRELKDRAGLDDPTARALRQSLDEATGRSLLEKVHAVGGKLLLFGGEGYPAPLAEIYAPPPLLFALGQWRPEDSKALAVIGSRRATTYGRRVAAMLARDLAARGFTVVSGMARGIDSEAHRGALAAGGRTIAVLGSGLDVPYPPEHAGLMREIASHGAVLTEFLPGTQPLAGNFPQRNRLISGLGCGVVVVEAAERSGAMITAGYALDQGKDVFAVPGSVETRTSRGTNLLIKKGAKLVQGVEDILEELPAPLTGGLAAVPELSKSEQAVWEALADGPLHVDALARALGSPPASLLATLLTMELRGVVRQEPGKIFGRS